MNIWLDDVRVTPEGWVHAKNIEDIENIIEILKVQKEERIEKISLDFHLAHPKNGLDVVKLLAEICKELGDSRFWPEEIIYHTNDPEGERLMRKFVDDFERKGINN